MLALPAAAAPSPNPNQPAVQWAYGAERWLNASSVLPTGRTAPRPSSAGTSSIRSPTLPTAASNSRPRGRWASPTAASSAPRTAPNPWRPSTSPSPGASSDRLRQLHRRRGGPGARRSGCRRSGSSTRTLSPVPISTNRSPPPAQPRRGPEAPPRRSPLWPTPRPR